MDSHASPLRADLAARITNLQSTAEYITCLSDCVRDHLKELQGLVEKYGAGAVSSTEWGRAEILLNLLDTQSKIVMDVSEAFDIARVEVVA